MKLTIEKNELTYGLTMLAGVIEKRNVLPILANVVIDATGDSLTFRATDTDVEVTVAVSAEISEPGATTVNFDLLNNIAKKLPSGKLVTIEGDDKLTVEAGRSQYDLAALPVDDFPSIANDQFDVEFEMNAVDLDRILSKTGFAVSTEETKWFLNGVYFHSTDQGLTGVATDGHKLAKAWCDNDADIPGVIIPRKTVLTLGKILSDGNVTVSVSETKIKIDCGDVVVLSKVIDGTFPDYERIIPTGMPDSVKVSAKAFSDASARVATVSEDKVRKVTMNVSNDNVELSVVGPMNSAKDDIDAIVTGENACLAFNSVYLKDALAQSDGGDVVFQYNAGNPTSPALIEATEDDKFIAVVMPMRG